jgi:hypothetical protein
MALVTKRGKYAKYRYEAFSKLAELTDKLLLNAGAWSEITADRVAYNRFVFECKGGLTYILYEFYSMAWR